MLWFIVGTRPAGRPWALGRSVGAEKEARVRGEGWEGPRGCPVPKEQACPLPRPPGCSRATLRRPERLQVWTPSQPRCGSLPVRAGITWAPRWPETPASCPLRPLELRETLGATVPQMDSSWVRAQPSGKEGAPPNRSMCCPQFPARSRSGPRTPAPPRPQGSTQGRRGAPLRGSRRSPPGGNSIVTSTCFTELHRGHRTAGNTGQSADGKSQRPPELFLTSQLPGNVQSR